MEDIQEEDRLHRLQKNPKWMFGGKVFLQFGSMQAVMGLFYLHRGLTLSQIFYTGIIWSLTTLVFEVPTGYLADRWGRRRTLILGALLAILTDFAMFVAHGFPAFIAVFILLAASFACFSGTEEALLFDTLKEAGHEHKMTSYNGKLSAANRFAKIFLPTLGAFIAKDLFEWQFRTLIGLDFIGDVIGLFFLLQLIEPRHSQRVEEVEKGIFRQSLETIRHEPLLSRLALNKLLIFIASFLVWRGYQPYFLAHGIHGFWFASFYFFLQGTIFISDMFIGVTEKKIGTVRIVTGTGIACMMFLVLLLFATTPSAIFVAVFGLILFQNIRDPVFAHLMNTRIRAKSRATTLSNLNVLKSFLDIPMLLLSGWMAAKDPRFVFVIAGALCVIALIVFPVRTRDLTAT